MSNTPRTNNFISDQDGVEMTEGEIAMCNFARKLELQNLELRDALTGLIAEYDDRQCQFGDNYLWQKHEDANVIKCARRVAAKTKEAAQ